MSQSTAAPAFGMPFKLNVRAAQLTAEQFTRLCQENPDFRLELTAQQELVIMAPRGSETGRRNSRLIRHLDTWAETDGSGLVFDSSVMSTLPNGAMHSPDAAWIKQERWNKLTTEQREGFAPLCPDFVAELRSLIDRLSDLDDKMDEYIN